MPVEEVPVEEDEVDMIGCTMIKQSDDAIL
jgi:hypothetical protein